MRRLTMVALSALALGGCAGTHISKPAVCDGKHRRPANLYGTTLPTLPIPLPASQGGGRSMVAPGPGRTPEALPSPPSIPAPAPAPDPERVPAPAPTTGSSSPPTTPQTSQRTIALSYFSC